jgi:glycosyltransferase involved in cell wall biosynthesis
MKILYLNPAGAVGGAERVLLDLIASLRALNPEWSLNLITAADGELVEDARRLGVETRVMAFPPSLAVVGDAGVGGPAGSGAGLWRVMGRLSASSAAVARYVRELHRAISELQPDMIHSNGLKMHLLGAWAVPGSTPLLWHIHDFIQVRPLMRRLMRMRAARCAILVANSKSVAEDARIALGENRPIQTVYNAVDLERFAPYGAKFDLDAAAGLAYPEGGTVRVGLIATAARWKGHDLFMRALARIPNDLPIRGYIIGGPIYQTEASQFTLDQLRETATQLSIGDKVGFTGFVSQVPAAIRALDIVVHASISPEPFGLVIAEALASGRAVLTNGLGGAGELIRQGRDAMLYRAGDTDSLAEEITRLARDASLRRKLGQAARATAEQRFARERMGREFAEIYRRIAVEEARRSDEAATRT